MAGKRLLWVQTLLFAGIGIALMYLSFRKTNFSEIWQVIQSGNHLVMIPIFLVSVWVLVARSFRWQLLYKSAGFQAPFNHLFVALTTGYLVNLAIPRLGEITRAWVLKRSLNYPVNTSLGTILFERVADLICLAGIIGFAFLLEFFQKGSLLGNFTQGISLFEPQKIIMLTILIGGLLVAWFFLKARKDSFSEWIKKIVETSLKLIQMENKFLFLFHTLTIWIGFYLMTYLWFFMFPESAGLSMQNAYLVMVLGVVARTLPIQAGSAGAYHFVVSQALLLLGVNLLTGNALAIVIHGFQTILTLIFGFTSYLWLVYYEKKHAKQTSPSK